MLEHLNGRMVRVVAQGAVLMAVVGGSATYGQHDKKINLIVDGHARQVQDDAGTVGALLAHQGISVSAHDLVAPAPASDLSDGNTVVIRYGRPLTLTADGRQRVYWTTELTVDRALSRLGMRNPGALVSVSRSQAIGRKGLVLSVSTPKSVTLAADGRVRSVTTLAPTVRQLLSEWGITLGPLDAVSAGLASPTENGLVVAVTRIQQRRTSSVVTVPYGTRTQKTPLLPRGTSKVAVAGATGSRRVVYAVTIANGQVVGRSVASTTMLKPPRARVVNVGTKPKTSSPASGSSGGGSVSGADSLNWTALARCESGGNPRAVNPAGYYGLYQFSLATWRSVGGSGNPINASAAEQTHRAKLLFKKGGSGQWGCGSHLYD